MRYITLFFLLIFSNGCKNSQFEYYPNGNMKIEFSNIGNHEFVKSYYPNKNLEKSFYVLNDKLDSTYLEYNSEEKVKLEKRFKNGKLHGITRYYKEGSMICYEEYYTGTLCFRECQDSFHHQKNSMFQVNPKVLFEKELQKEDSILNFKFHLDIENTEYSNNNFTLMNYIEYYKSGKQNWWTRPKTESFVNNVINKSFILEKPFDSLLIFSAVHKIDGDSLDYYTPSGVFVIPQ